MPGPSSAMRCVRTLDPQWSFAVYWKLMQDALPSGFSTWNSLSSLELIMALQGLGGSQWLASVCVPENALGWDLRHLALLQAARLWWDKDNLFPHLWAGWGNGGAAAMPPIELNHAFCAGGTAVLAAQRQLKGWFVQPFALRGSALWGIVPLKGLFLLYSLDWIGIIMFGRYFWVRSTSLCGGTNWEEERQTSKWAAELEASSAATLCKSVSNPTPACSHT